MKRASLVVGAVVLGILIGLMIQQPRIQREEAETQRHKELATEAAHTAIAAEEKALQAGEKAEILEQKNRELQHSIGLLREPWDTVNIPKDLIRDRRVRCFLQATGDGWPPRVADDLATILRMTEPEREAVDAAIARAVVDLGGCELKKAQVQKSEDTSVTLVIPQQPETETAVHKQLLEALTLALDENRVETWQLLDGGEANSLFSLFSARNRTLTLTKMNHGQYRCEERIQNPQKENHQSSTILPAARLARFSHLTKLLPEAIRKDVPPMRSVPQTPAPHEAAGDEVF